jgi:alpha-ribazole phosphatase
VAGLTLWLIRHGLASGGEGRCIGRSDLALADEGRAQIRRLVATVEGVPDAIYSSDRARARDSAAMLASAWSRAVMADARLRELDFGVWEGRTWEELEREDGARLQQWMRDWVHERPPGGESMVDLRDRVAAWVAEVRERTPDGQVAVVAHAGSIRALLCHLLGLPSEAAFRFRITHGRLSVVTIRPQGAEVESLNAIA